MHKSLLSKWPHIRVENILRKKYLFYGQHPPPLSGQNILNSMVSKFLRSKLMIDEIPLGLSWYEKVFNSILVTCLIILRHKTYRVFYLSMPGQKGAIITLPAIFFSRLLGIKVLIHHHSFQRFNQHAPLIRIIQIIADNCVTHIVLCEKMASNLVDIYKVNPANVYILPNVSFFEIGSDGFVLADVPFRPISRTFGHISVLSHEKGTLTAIKIFEILAQHNIVDKLIIAGPFKNLAFENEFRAILSKHKIGKIEYVGPVSGGEKFRFFDRISTLIFPTKLPDEADPLVLLEAYSRGVIVFSNSRGCIPERIMQKNHLLTEKLICDIENIKSILVSSDYLSGNLSIMAREHFEKLLLNNANIRDDFLKLFETDHRD